MISSLPMLYEEALNDRVIDGAVNAIAQADLLIVGVGASYQDAVETVGRIVDETYRETGGFDVKTYLREKEDRLRKKR